MPQQKAQLVPQLATWWIMVSRGVSPHIPTITHLPITIRYVASCGTGCAFCCGTNFFQNFNMPTRLVLFIGCTFILYKDEVYAWMKRYLFYEKLVIKKKINSVCHPWGGDKRHLNFVLNAHYDTPLGISP